MVLNAGVVRREKGMKVEEREHRCQRFNLDVRTEKQSILIGCENVRGGKHG